MEEKYVPKNEEERQLLEEFEVEMKKITEAKESAQSETKAIKKLIEAEREKRISAEDEYVELKERWTKVEERSKNNKQKTEDFEKRSSEIVEKRKKAENKMVELMLRSDKVEERRINRCPKTITEELSKTLEKL